MALQACNFTEMRLQHRHFLVNITKFLRTPILKNNSANNCLWFAFVLNPPSVADTGTISKHFQEAS